MTSHAHGLQLPFLLTLLAVKVADGQDTETIVNTHWLLGTQIMIMCLQGHHDGHNLKD